MPTDTEIQTERERLYDSAALREDVNDDEATVLLEWGEKHVVRLGQAAADSADLEQKARFLRQLLKNINRFVGQRQYNDRAGQLDYMEKVTKWLANPTLGFKNHTADELLDKLPSDTKDMAATLRAMLDAIDPSGNSGSKGTPDAPPVGRLGALQEAVSAQSTPNDDDLSRPSLRDVAAQSTHQADSHVPDDVGRSVIDQLREAGREKPDSYQAQPDTKTDNPSPLDLIRQSVTENMQEKHPDSKGKEGLESLRQSVEKTQDEPSPSDDARHSNISPRHGQIPAEQKNSRHDHLINPPHTREEDEGNGKTAK